MTNWKYSLKLKDLLTSDEDEETVRRVATETSVRVDAFRKLHFPNGWENSVLSDFVEEINRSAIYVDIDLYNDTLDELYDWADEHSVWIE